MVLFNSTSREARGKLSGGLENGCTRLEQKLPEQRAVATGFIRAIAAD
jgi:hypothetical protein